MSSPKEQLNDNGGWQRKAGRRKWAKRQYHKWVRRMYKQYGKDVDKKYEGWAL